MPPITEKLVPAIKKNYLMLVIIIILLAVIVLLVEMTFSLYVLTSRENFSAPFYTATRAVQSKLEEGNEGDSERFELSTGKKTFPKFSSLEFSPYIVKDGSNQKIIISVVDPESVRQVRAEIKTDNEVVSLDFSQTGSKSEESFWEAEWQARGVEKEVYYQIDFEAVAESGGTEKMSAFFRAKPYEISE